MSYTRGDVYIYRTGDDASDCMNIWSQDSYVDVVEHGWGKSTTAGGISVPLAIFDEVAVMRTIELIVYGQLNDVLHRCAKKDDGNQGNEKLIEEGGKIALLLNEYFKNT